MGVLVALHPAARAADAAPPVPPRFRVALMDTNASPREDFRQFAFGRWIRENPIPADKSSWSAFGELSEFNWAALRHILESVSAERHPAGSAARQVADFFASAMDEAAINAAGIGPVQPDLDRIAAVASASDLVGTVAHFHDHGVEVLFGALVLPDEKESRTNALYVVQGGLSLPSRDYYFAPQFEGQRAEFVRHIAILLLLAGDDPESAAAGARTVFEVEKSLAENARTPVELRDPLANYNKMSRGEVAAKLPGFAVDDYLRARGIEPGLVPDVIVGQPAFLEGLQRQLRARPLADWRKYLRYRVLADAAPALAAPFERERFRFYGTILGGTPAMEPRWQRAARMVDAGLGEALGRLYVDRYYPPEARARMDAMITNMRAVMRERLQRLEWMSGPTREKALAKFDRFEARIGHPDRFRDYSSILVQRTNLLANLRATTRFEVRRRTAGIGRPVDKSEWLMTPPTVNAYFEATANKIFFPAGVLQPPFFDFTLDDAVNYGAIGAVIGHEITHGFDDQGRRYDANGNLVDWWSPEDAGRFTARTVALIEQYNQYAALPGLHINGALSLGENIADLGGVSIAFEALQRSLAGKPRPLIDGFTPEQRFFLSWAQLWRTQFRDEALRRQIAVGPHSPGMFRAIGPISNMPEFFEAFGIREGDGMWRPPSVRVKIW